jgi:PAS domain S-box-containing protein
MMNAEIPGLLPEVHTADPPSGQDPPAPQEGFQLNRKWTLFFFRILILLIILVFLFFSGQKSRLFLVRENPLFFLAFGVSIVGFAFLRNAWLENKFIISGIFILDILFVTAGLYFVGVSDSDLFLVFFITVFISALSQDVRSVFLVAIVSCALYGFLQYKTTGALPEINTDTMVRFPLLFVGAAMSGYLAMETKKQKEEHLRLAGKNLILAQQADTAALKLIETNRRLKSLLEYHHNVLASITTGIIVVQKDGRVRTFNSGARHITGYVEAEIAGRTLEEFPENLKTVASTLRTTLAEGKGAALDRFELTRENSETVPVTLETSVLKAGNGEVTGAIATLKDVTQLRQMEIQLLRSERFSALGEMAAGMAHEIKNPLNAVLGFSQRLHDRVENPSLKKYAGIISDEVKRMDGIVNDILEYSRPDRLNRAEAHLEAILKETVEFSREKIEKAGVSVAWALDPSAPVLQADIPKIRQVLLNLILNAVQAMGPSGGSLTLKTSVVEGFAPALPGRNREVVLNPVFLQQTMVLVEVMDTGCGITKENMSKLFHPFFTTKPGGTGLGLSICQKIVAAHGGTLEVRSTVGAGSDFMVYLPVEPPNQGGSHG